MNPPNRDEPKQFIPVGFQDGFRELLRSHQWDRVPNATIDHLAEWMAFTLREEKKGFGTGGTGVVIPD